MFACLFCFIEIISCAINSPQPTAQVEIVKAVSPADASVQVVVDRGLLKSRFSGTAIAPNLVVTCWHGFRDKGSVSVNGKPAKLLRFDAVSDVALVETNETLASVPLASKPLAKGESATAYGYEYIRQGLWKFPTKITAINRYAGFSNQSILGRPNQGRSGGGLFNEAGELIGVCSASDGNEGLYCGLEAVQKIVNSNSARQILTPTVELKKPALNLTDCPDGRCPLVKSNATRPSTTAPVLPLQSPMLLKRGQDIRRIEPSIVAGTQLCSPVCKGGLCNQPTLAPPEPQPAVITRPLASVMVRSGHRVRGLFSGRIVQRIFGRR